MSGKGESEGRKRNRTRRVSRKGESGRVRDGGRNGREGSDV